MKNQLASQQGVGPLIFPISQCVPEIFVLILQAVVDDEASQYPAWAAHYAVKPRMAVRLALVCKSWKELVYKTPSFWAVLPINLLRPMENIKNSLSQFVNLAKSGPVDLYFFYLHEHGHDYDKSHSPAACPSTEASLQFILSHIPNIRKLQISGVGSGMQILFGSLHNDFPTIREAIFYSPLHMDISGPILLDTLVHMQNLRSLQLQNISAISFPFHSTAPILQHLRILSIHSSVSRPLQGDFVPALLSHSPNIETLTLWVPVIDEANYSYNSMPISLLLLKSIVTHNAMALSPASHGITKMPSLTKIHIGEWSPDLDHKTIEILKYNPTITDLYLGVTDASQYEEVLRSLPQLKRITLRGMGDGAYLYPLLNTGPDNLPVLARCLERITLNMPGRPLLLTIFENLVISRCMPIDSSAKTATGCSASVLEIASGTQKTALTAIRGSRLWNEAEITKRSSGALELRWNRNG